MRIGDLVDMTSCTAVTPSAKFGFKAPKKHKFVFLLLGVVEDGKEFDARKALNDLGYVPDPSLEE